MFLNELMLLKQVHQKLWYLCHYWHFLNYSFKFQPNVGIRSHDVLMMSIKLSGIAILKIKGSDSHCIISLISKNEAINLMIHKRWSKLTHKHYSKLTYKRYLKSNPQTLLKN